MLYPRLSRRHFDNKCTVKVLVIVNTSPWGGSLGVTALRLVRAMSRAGLRDGDGVRDGVRDGLRVAAVYFREEGVYQAVPGRVADAGTPVLRDAWLELMREAGVPLLLCSSAAQRRLGVCPEGGFREAGRAEVLELMQGCDRVVAF
jgi:sulfur relay (sulfurtransferase) complex TusBCD TusD component (DsrE family)